MLPIIVIALIWYPYVMHFYLPGEIPGPDVVEELRRQPSDSLLQELTKQDVVAIPIRELERDPVTAANQFIRGEFEPATLNIDLQIGGWWGSSAYPAVSMRGLHMPFAASDVLAMPEAWKLSLFGFAVPRLYLQAYHQTGDQQYLVAARDFILSWIDFEITQWRPDKRDLLWDDHAIAQRAQVLIEFWYAYRHSSVFSSAAAQRILGFTCKIGRMLADPRLYTLRSNHGVMQNLELMQLRLAFPAIVSFAAYGELAWRRLSTQLPHYIDSEGAVLEHSAEYQEFGVTVLGPILRDATLLGISVPSEIASRYDRAIAAYAMLRRPDGTLPRYGDTASPFGDPGPSITKPDADGNFSPIEPMSDWRPPAADLLLPSAGTAIWWSGLAHWSWNSLSQVIMTWSHFPTHIHKHADDLSFHLWADGQDWWSAEGYLVYLPAQASIPEPWDGSNAPHLAGEPWLSDRHSTLLGYAHTTNLTAVDVERQSADGFSVRRQVVQAGPGRWIVIDSFQDRMNREVRTVWLTGSKLSHVVEKPGGRFRLLDPLGNEQLEVTFLGSPDPSVTVTHGSLRPFVGWISEDFFGIPTDAFVVTQPSRHAWAINVSRLRHSVDSGKAEPARLLDWQTPDDWALSIPGSDGNTVLRRLRTSVTAEFASGKFDQVTLEQNENAMQSAQAVAAYERDLAEYPKGEFKSWSKRVQKSLILVALLATQQLVMFAAYRWYPAALSSLRVSALAGWTIIGVWLFREYF